MEHDSRIISRVTAPSLVGAVLLFHAMYAVVSNYPLSQPPADAIGPGVVLTLVFGEASIGGLLLAFHVARELKTAGLVRAAIVLSGGLVGVSAPVAWLIASPWWTGGGPPPYRIALLLSVAFGFVVEVASWDG